MRIYRTLSLSTIGSDPISRLCGLICGAAVSVTKAFDETGPGVFDAANSKTLLLGACPLATSSTNCPGAETGQAGDVIKEAGPVKFATDKGEDGLSEDDVVELDVVVVEFVELGLLPERF